MQQVSECQNLLCFFVVVRKQAHKYMKLLHDILHLREYANLPRLQQLIIRDGLTKKLCNLEAFLINEPHLVPEVCKNLTSDR